jgi:hypothetical protein
MLEVESRWGWQSWEGNDSEKDGRLRSSRGVGFVSVFQLPMWLDYLCLVSAPRKHQKKGKLHLSVFSSHCRNEQRILSRPKIFCS